MRAKLILPLIAFLACDSESGFSPIGSSPVGLRVSGEWTETRGVRENSCSTRLPKIASQLIVITQTDGQLTLRTGSGHERLGTIDAGTGDFEVDALLEIAGETWPGVQSGRFFSGDSFGARTFVHLIDTASADRDSCRVVTSDVGQKGMRSTTEGVEGGEPGRADWQEADPELQPIVEEARRALARLEGR